MTPHEKTHGNILIVDDTPENLAILTSMLTEHGYFVRPAINGEVALKAVQKHQPDLILLDIMMPQMSGYEVCGHLKANEQTRDIPVIFISALNKVFDKVKAFSIGGVDYITKPFQIEEVLARVETHLMLRRLYAELQDQNQRLIHEVAERTRAEEALKEIETAMKLWIETAKKHGKPIPKPKSKIINEPKKRFNVIFPESLLNEVDEYRGKHGMKRSELLAVAAEHFISSEH